MAGIRKTKTLPVVMSAILTSFFIMLPAIIWIIYDRSPFGGDQSWYAKASIELYKAWSVSPIVWVKEMIHVSETKAPGIIWIGQFFVPIGLIFGSIDSALMLLIVIMLALALILIYLSIYTLSGGQTLTAMIGCFFIALSPLFLVLFRHYLTEPMQLLSIAWFVFIMSRSLQWTQSLILAQLLAASSFAVLAKVSSPLYFIIIWFYLMYCIFRVRQPRCSWGWRQRSSVLTLIFSAPLILLMFVWYSNNIKSVLMHVSVASSGPVAAVWGKIDTYWGTFLYWSEAFVKCLFFPITLIIGSTFVAAGFVKYLKNINIAQKHFAMCAACSILQILVVLLVFSKSDNREVRYLFALLPYIAIAVGWGISQFNKSFIVAIAASIIIVSWGIGWLYGIGRIGMATSVSDLIQPVDILGKDAKILNEIARRTCNDSSEHGYLNLVAIDPLLKSDWLAPVPADYEAIKLQLLSKINGFCRYGYIGNGFFGASANDAWASILMLRPLYIVIPDPDRYPPSTKVINQTLNTHNFPEIFRKISESGWFTKEFALNEDEGILVFKFRDLIAEGRRLSDEGWHSSAIELLEKASKTEQLNNAEIWATLQLALLRDGQYEKSKEAGLHTLELSPKHYWALKNQAMSHSALHEWHEVVSFGNRALTYAPNHQESAEVITMLAHANEYILENK